MTCRRRVVAVGLGPMLVVIAGCGGNPVAPTAPTPHPSPISALTISTLPAALTVGQVVPLTASVTLPSGGQKQLAGASWQSSNSGVATVSSTGVVTVTGFGVADIVARAYGQSATTCAFAPAPPRTNLTTVIDSRGSIVGLCDATNITFDLSASTGAGLRYDLTYGDGASTSDARSRHVFGCKGQYNQPNQYGQYEHAVRRP